MRVRVAQRRGRFARLQKAVTALTHYCFAMAAMVGLAGGAHANGVLVAKGKSVAPAQFNVFIGHDGETQTLVESIDVRAFARTIGLIQVFPSKPTEVRAVGENFFDDLALETTVRQPHRERLQESLFGPSLVNWALHRLREPTPSVETAFNATERLSVDPKKMMFFRGKTWTSTASGIRHLPVELEEWLSANDLVPTRAEQRTLMQYCDSGWVIAATLIDTRNASGAIRGRIGPTLYRFKSQTPIHPISLGLARAKPAVPFNYWLMTSGPFIPADIPSMWDEQPWDSALRAAYNVFEISYSRDFNVGGAFDPFDTGSPNLTPTPYLTKATTRFSGSPPGEVHFVPAQNAKTLPVSGGRNTGFDLLLCLLLGLAPLLYTPESWLLLWLHARTKDRAGAGPGLFLWPLYAVIVGAYWALTLEGAGRAAAVLPIGIGLLRLITVRPDRQANRVRASFTVKRR